MPLWHGTESKQTKQWKGHILVVDTFVPHQKGGKNFKAVLLKMAFACMWYFWKFPNELPIINLRKNIYIIWGDIPSCK